MERVNEMSPRCTQPAPGRARTQTGISRAPVQSKALSKMTGHFLNSCGRYTKNFAFDPSPFKRQGKERKESLRRGGSPFPTPCCLQAAPYPTEICKVSCSCAWVKLLRMEPLLDVLAGGCAECRVWLPSPGAEISEGALSDAPYPLQILAPVGSCFSAGTGCPRPGRWYVFRF